VNKLESRVALGAFRSLIDPFVTLRQRYERLSGDDFSAGATLIPGSSASKSMEEEEEEAKSAEKEWILKKTSWDVDFKTMDVELKQLKALYYDKAVVSFDRDREKSLNRKIARLVKKLQSGFSKMKTEVDNLNAKLYCKDKSKYCGPGKEFENITEWRLAERIVTDLTTRLRDRQQNLNVIVMTDKRQAAFISKTTGSSDPEVARLEAVIQDAQDREALERESQDVQEIVGAVREIVKMVQQMSMMITEQGTIVDRIDYNLEVASARSLKGQGFFEKAETKNKQAGAMALWCVGVLVVLNTILAILILKKIHDDN